MKAILLYNPRSGKGRIERHLDAIVEIFRQSEIEIRPKLLDFDKDPFEGDEDVELVVICGGDGSINYVVHIYQLLQTILQ